MDALEKIMGLTFNYEKVDMKKRLPLFISGTYEFKKASSGDLCFILIHPLSEIPMLPTLKKQIYLPFFRNLFISRKRSR